MPDNKQEEEMEGAPSSDAGDETTNGVTVSEEFQKNAYNLLEGATKAELSYLSNCVFDMQAELRKKEDDSKEFSTEEMPSQD